MAIYRFKIVFEDYDEVIREIELKATQSFEDFHNAIHKSIGFKPEYSSSFYISNDYWYKGYELTLLPGKIKNPEKSTLMAKARLCDYIEDPHQKFYYIFNFDNPWNFQIELIKIIVDADLKKEYPVCVKTINEAPKQYGISVTAAAAALAAEGELSALFKQEDLDEEDHLGLKELMTEGVEDEEEAEEEEESVESDDEFGGGAEDLPETDDTF